MKQHKITLTNEEISNFICSVEYLKDILENIDVSDDFAGFPEETVTAYSLITDNILYKKLYKINVD